MKVKWRVTSEYSPWSRPWESAAFGPRQVMAGPRAKLGGAARGGAAEPHCAASQRAGRTLALAAPKRLRWHCARQRDHESRASNGTTDADQGPGRGSHWAHAVTPYRSKALRPGGRDDRPQGEGSWARCQRRTLTGSRLPRHRVVGEMAWCTCRSVPSSATIAAAKSVRDV